MRLATATFATNSDVRAIEYVTAHLRWFEEDSRSEVVFWIDELSIEFGCLCFIVEEHVLLSALQHIFAGLKRTRDQKLSSGLSYPSLLVEDKRACWLRSGFQHDSYLQ